ncbi:glycosyltransferase involved in cell wall biosynthesis [Cellulophaga sp. RHA19]|nr:glycosyltransferase involved in cell wall biosynthesis [Cellulophaga sp. RHA19]
MEPIRVLQVLTIMNRGGAETMIMNYYRAMDRKKVQFDFLLHRREKGAFDDEIKELGGNIYYMPAISPKNYINYKKELNSFFYKNKNYKIVHSHLNALSFFVLRAAKQNNVPVRIAHSHTSLLNLNLNPFSKKRDSFKFIFKFVLQNYFKSKVTNYANYYYTCGEKAGNWLFGKDSNYKIINNAINTSSFTYNKSIGDNLKRELCIHNKKIIGHVGNFVPEKNHTFILNVFYEFKKIENDSILLLIGGGNNETIKKQAQELGIFNDVMFLGVRSDVANLLQAIDLFLFPSTNEGLPVTLIEAQAAGLKVIASDEISTELKITDLISFLSLKESPKNWAKTIKRELNYQRKNTMQNIIDGDYDIKNNAKSLEEFYSTSVL